MISRLLARSAPLLLSAVLTACGTSPPVPPDSPDEGDTPDEIGDGPIDDQPAEDQPEGDKLAEDKPKAEPKPAKPDGCGAPEDCADKGIDGKNPGMLEWACNQGLTRACAELSTWTIEGNGVPKDANRGLALAQRACDGDNASGCWNVALMYAKKDSGITNDLVKSHAAFLKACQLGRGQACYFAGTNLFFGKGMAEDKGEAIRLFDKGCTLKYGEGCHNVGAAYLNGEGVTKDRPKALSYFATACKLGEKDDCELQKKLAAELAGPSAKPAGVPGANLNIGEMTADGVTVRDLSCRLEGGIGLFTSMAIVGGLAKRKQSLDRCAPKGAAPLVRWTFAGGRVTKVTVESLGGPAKACVSRAIKGARFAGSGECAARLLVGNKQGAEKAAKAAK